MEKKPKNDLDTIAAELDQWVSRLGSGRYIPPDFVSTADQDYGLPENFGIQQVRSEILEFASVVLSNNKTAQALEIGLGYFGSTHFLWRMLFDHVATVEYQKDRVFQFRENTNKYFGKHVLDDGKSAFFFGSSSEPATLKKVRGHFDGKRADMLFIDGDHRYEGVLADWLLYHHLVGPGGIVAFHDVVAQISVAGVPKFIEDLSAGKIDGVKRDLRRIVQSRDCGIAYYIQET
jgi:cephalosporin hydroxylase